MKYLQYLVLLSFVAILAACGQNAALDEGIAASDLVRFNVAIVDEIDADGNRIVEVFQFRNQTVNYRIVAANDDPLNPTGDPRGCNVNSDNPATIKLNVPEGVTATPSWLTFTACASPQPVTFSSPIPGNYPITVDPEVEGGVTDSKWASDADFILQVRPLATVTLNPSAPDGEDGWYTSNVNLTVTGVTNIRCALRKASDSAPATLFHSSTPGCAYTADIDATERDVSEDGEWVLYYQGRTTVDMVQYTQDLQSQSFKIDKTLPVVTCNTPAPSFTVGQPDAEVSATVSDAGSGPVVASVSALANVGTLGSNHVGVAGYDQAGNSATQECSYEVVAGTPDFSFNLSTLPAKTFGDAPFSVASYASTNSSGAITFALGSSSSGCDVTPDGQVTITGATTGASSCVIEATLAADDNYAAAGPISQGFHIARADQVISWPTPADITHGTALGAAQLNATLTKGDGTLSYTPGVGTLLDVGENHELRVDAAETANFKAASMTVMIRVKVAPKVVSFESHTNNMTGNPTSGNATTTLTINRPNGEGNFLLAHITFEKGSDITITAPSSWVLVRRTDRFTDIGQVVFYKVATASEPTSYAWNFSQSVKAAGGILRYSGVDTADPIITSSGAGGDSSTLTAPSVGADAESMLVAFFGFKKKDTTLSEPNGLRRLYNFQNPQDVTTFAADDFRESAGATGNLVSRPSPNNSDKWVAQAVVLRAK